MRNRHAAIADARLTHQTLRVITEKSGMTVRELITAQHVISGDSPMRFGKHKGLPIKDFPSDYVLWLARKLEPKDHRLREALRQTHGI